MQVGFDLQASFKSDFSENELDRVAEEVLYIRRRLGDNFATATPVRTVADFRSLVERFATENAAGAQKLMMGWEKEMTMASQRPWRGSSLKRSAFELAFPVQRSGFTGKCLFLRFSGTRLVCSASIFSVASFSAS